MPRLAGSLLVALAAFSVQPAMAADVGRNTAAGFTRGVEAVGGRCRGPRVVVAYYQEQICHRGAAGYAECRWVKREHEVEVPAACEPRYTVEQARPADRGAFPPFPHVGPRG